MLLVPGRQEREPTYYSSAGNIEVYADGSKLDGRIGVVVFSGNPFFKLLLKPLDHCSMSQVELMEAVKHIGNDEYT